MRTGLLIILGCCILLSCGKKDSIPSNVLPQQKMQAVLFDMLRADQFLSDYVLNKDTGLNRDTESIRLYKKVFAIHDITKKEFQESFAFYNAHPALMKTIMDSLAVDKTAVVKVVPPKVDTALRPDVDTAILPGKKIQARPDRRSQKNKPLKVE